VRLHVWVPIVCSFAGACTIVRAVGPEPIPKGVREVHDLAYAYPWPDADRGRLDLYLPPGPGPHPVLVFIHGGYWQTGGRGADFGVYRRLGRRLAARGVLTVVPSYRLAPTYRFPTQIDDIAKALASVRANIQRFGGDRDRIWVMGHSAGGHLALLAALDPSRLGALGLSPRAFGGFISISGIYSIGDLAASGGGQRSVPRVFGSNEDDWAKASPIEHILEAGPVPKIMMAIGDDDPPSLRHQYDAMKHALGDAGIPAKAIEVANRTHISILTELFRDGDPLGEAVLGFMGVH
jgi:acetyl esterase/lipase